MLFLNVMPQKSKICIVCNRENTECHTARSPKWLHGWCCGLSKTECQNISLFEEKTFKLTWNNTESKKLSTQDRLIINRKNCHLEREQKVKIIRCCNCQKFGHKEWQEPNNLWSALVLMTAQESVVLNQSVQIAKVHTQRISSLCPVYLAYHANLTKQPDIHEDINLPPQASP